jgi:hypothetical protein
MCDLARFAAVTVAIAAVSWMGCRSSTADPIQQAISINDLRAKELALDQYRVFTSPS